VASIPSGISRLLVDGRRYQERRHSTKQFTSSWTFVKAYHGSPKPGLPAALAIRHRRSSGRIISRDQEIVRTTGNPQGSKLHIPKSSVLRRYNRAHIVTKLSHTPVRWIVRSIPRQLNFFVYYLQPGGAFVDADAPRPSIVLSKLLGLRTVRGSIFGTYDPNWPRVGPYISGPWAR